MDDFLAIVFLPVFDDVLDDVVAVRVLDQGVGAGVELGEDLALGVFGAVFEHALDYAAAVGVGRERVDVALEGFDDELDVFARDALDCFLDDVVAVLVFDAFEDVAVEFLDEGGLLLCEDVFEGLKVSKRSPVDSDYTPFERLCTRTFAN